MKEALENIKVIDLCRSYPPALASAMMGDFGAEVIRIDVPGFTFPVPMKGGPEAFSAYYYPDRNKRALSLNLQTKESLDIFYRLARQSDVIIENSKPGTMDGLGIGYSKIEGINPRLIYCSVSGYGQDGPYRDLPGHDSNYLGIAGALSLIGEKDGPPVMPSNIVADVAGAAMHALTAVLFGLLARERTGQGQFIDLSYTDAVFSLLSMQTAMHFLTGIPQRRGEFFTTGGEPFIASYKTKDGEYFNIACAENWLWANLCRALGCEQFISHQWTQDQQKKEEIFSFMEKTFLTKTRDEWWEWAKDKDVAAAPVLYLEEAFDNPQILHRQMIQEMDHPSLGKVTQVGTPFKLSDTPARHKRFSPTQGQHTNEILEELGYDQKEIQAFKEKKII